MMAKLTDAEFYGDGPLTAQDVVDAIERAVAKAVHIATQIHDGKLRRMPPLSARNGIAEMRTALLTGDARNEQMQQMLAVYLAHLH